MSASGQGGTKRSRTPNSAGREPDQKRQKGISGAAAAAHNAAHPRNTAGATAAVGVGVPPPQSPSNSSRARSRKSSAKNSANANAASSAAAAAAAAASGGHVGAPHGAHPGIAQQVIGVHPGGVPGVAGQPSAVGVANAGAVAAAGAGGGNRRVNRAPTSTRLIPQHAPSSFVSVAGIPMPGLVRTTTLQRRLFGQEIQCLMHSFGEVRHCARDVLEIMEDAVRKRVREVALAAADRVLELAEQQGMHAGLYKSRIPVSVSQIAYSLRRDSRAVNRLNQIFETMASKTVDQTAVEKLKARRTRPAETTWELVRELSVLPDPSEAREQAHGSSSGWWAERVSRQQTDVYHQCTYRAHVVFQKNMGKTQLQEFYNCRSVSFTRQESRSRAPTVQGKPRVQLFRDWLDLGAKENVYVPDDAVYALGQVAWETVGMLTQTALMHRHFDEIARGNGDPRSSEWSIGRHVLSAVGYGIAQAVMVPLTEQQALSLDEELIRFDTPVSSQMPTRWRGFGKPSTPCLLPCHLREAVRRLERAPDAPWGFGP